MVRDDFQNQGIGSALLSYITQVAKKQGLLGFTADILHDNAAVMRLIEKVGFKVGKKLEGGVYTVRAEL